MSTSSSNGRSGSPTTSVTSSRASTRTNGPASTSNLESTITRLLVATKQLLEGLAKWSRGEVSEEAISAIYVKLGNDFNVACAAFAREQIGMNELLSVPSDLRVCLETCLSDTPSQTTLEKHLPQVRQIIIGLLHGLREKQRLYRDGVAARRAREKAAAGAGSASRADTTAVQSGVPLTPNSAGRSRDELRRFVTAAGAAPPAAPSHPAYEDSASQGHRGRHSDGSVSTTGSSASLGRRGGGEASLGDSRLSAALSSRVNGPQRGGSLRERNGADRSSRSALEDIGFMPPPSSSSGYPTAPGMPRSTSTTSIDSAASAPVSVHSTSSLRARPRSPPPPARNRDEPPVPRTPTMDAFSVPSAAPVPPAPAAPAIPTTLVRPPSTASLHDDPPSLPSMPPPPLPPHHPHAQNISLEALKTSDHLSRRASKRYSAYAIQKMTSPQPGSSGSGGRTSPSRGGPEEGSPRPDRGGEPRRTKSEREHRSRKDARAPPPVPGIPRSWSSSQNLRAAGGAAAGGGSPIVEEEEDGFSSSPPSFPPPPVPAGGDLVRSGSAPVLSSPSLAPPTTSTPAYPNHLQHRVPSPALPPLPTDRATSTTPSSSPALPAPVAPSPSDGSLTLYLRLGPRVRRARLSNAPTSIEELRALFVERFGYTPGVGGWPEIYLSDERNGVRFELEEMEDLKDGVTVGLEVDAVEQVKHHIDTGLSTLSQEIKELRATVTAMRRQSVAGPSSLLSPDSANAGGFSPTLERGMRASPSQKQFENAAEMVLRMRRAGSTTSLAAPPGSEEGEKEKEDHSAPAPPAAAAPADAAASPSTATSIGPIVTTLKSQHAEVQNLRREIGILRQVYVDFTSATKQQFATLRVQTSHLHGLAQSKLSTDRAFVEAGTQKLDGDSTDLVVRVDELQDTIEQLRADTVRGVKPRPQQLSETASALRKAVEQRGKLEQWLKEVKPSWSQMWSTELSRILGEQKAVETQETLLGELDEDLQDADKVLRNIQAVVKQLKPSSSHAGAAPRLRELGGATDAAEGLNTVLMEVRALQPDPTKRLEAIERAEREREKQLAAGNTDDFKEELGAFVGEGKLKKSGGIEEAERLRQKRSEAALKAMFS
ncbi:hypothetical protein JCM10213_009334 [Rhodosporidiobolus nylandii]